MCIRDSTSDTGRRLIVSGCSLLLAGLLWGTQLHSAPNPRIALAAHLNCITEGMLTIIAGLLLVLPGVCSIGPRGASFVLCAHLLLWLQCGSEVLGAYTGAADVLKIATAQGNRVRGSAQAELLITLLHVGPGAALILAWGLMMLGVARRPGPRSTVEVESPMHESVDALRTSNDSDIDELSADGGSAVLRQLAADHHFVVKTPRSPGGSPKKSSPKLSPRSAAARRSRRSSIGV
eukprot:TRINITY_DN10250_c0_g1_i2.p1 TRINITY_DN10250_c0_g1~~TRINITY_DN10250_c0_g1_i2.p1  ORF type:complete len:260 (-),score=27.40 TRINITY_DN10250_c0_g1_i2:278-982(-)